MSDSIRVIHLCSARQYVGEAARVVDVADRMREMNHQVLVMARKSYSIAETCSRRGIPYTNVYMRSNLSFCDFLDVCNIRKAIAQINPHLLHAHRGKDHWLAAIALSGMRRKIKLIRSRHVVTPIKVHFANRWLFGTATDGVICVSNAVRQQVEAVSQMISGQVETITGGINQARFNKVSEEVVAKFRQRLHILPETKIVSCLARLAPVKGQEYIIRAIPRVIDKYPNTVFLFAYPRKSLYRDKLADLVQELNILESVRFLGAPDQLTAFLQMTDIGILASIDSEGWSRATTEFMYFGVPVVTTTVGCLPEIVQEGKNGYLVPPREPEAMADAIIKLLSDPLQRVRMGEYARDVVTRNYTNEHTVNRVLDFYNKIIQG